MALPDPAKRAGCPDILVGAPELEALAPFELPDGRKAVLLDTVRRRDKAVVDYLAAEDGPIGAWQACRSVVLYDTDWLARIVAPRR